MANLSKNAESGSAGFDYRITGRFPKALPTIGRERTSLFRRLQSINRGDSQPATYNRGPFDIATLAIFPEYLEFEGQEVLRLVVEGTAGRTVT